MNQLNLIASEKSIPELSVYLTDPHLCEPATQTLLALNKKVVAKEFVAALSQVEGKTAATLIRALGEVKCEGSVALITPFRIDRSIDFNALEKLVNLQIENLFKSGKSLGLIWQQFQNESQKLNFNYNYSVSSRVVEHVIPVDCLYPQYVPRANGIPLVLFQYHFPPKFLREHQ